MVSVRWQSATLTLCAVAMLVGSITIISQRQNRPDELLSQRYGRDPRPAGRHGGRNSGNAKLQQQTAANTQDLSEDSIDGELEKVLGTDEASVVKKSASHDMGSHADLDRMQAQLDHLKSSHKPSHASRQQQQLHRNFEPTYDAFEYPKKSDVGKSFVTGGDNVKGSGYPINNAASDADAPLFTTEDVAYQSPATIVPSPGSSFHVHPGLWMPHVDGEEWDYLGDKRGPYNWGKLKRAWDVCSNGFNQSPINIELNVKRNEELEPLRWFGPTHPYEATLVSPLYKNVITVENLKGYMMAGGVKMHLRSATVHTPSEHKFQGRHMNGEIQFLHTADVGGSDVQLVVSAFLTVSDGTAPALRTMMAAVKTFLGTYFVDKKGQYSYEGPLYQMDIKPSFWFSVAEIAEDLLGSGANYANYYTYYGSLTAPPCSEGVTWILLKQPIAISPTDHADLLSLQGHTARPIQAMGGREVYDTATGRSPGLESPVHDW